ncbi:unnamed protein product [Callosobruchus maculatus]|uniref:BHLH domain-containing protein n=1 Tax=Callosobruchus maculatus TaxID=64391 RepID=A0A653C132_CALMS|nr:unnamed protein product [Callosobruchus maculatus]
MVKINKLLDILMEIYRWCKAWVWILGCMWQEIAGRLNAPGLVFRYSIDKEEIDVVSVVDKLSFTINNRVSSLPNNPSTRDKQQIQRRVATAISRNNRMTNSAGAGIKTILPVRKNAPSLAESQSTTPTKRKSAVTSETRNTKRQLIPEVSKKDRAAKVLILKEASQYCDHLTRTSINQQKHMEDLKRHQEWLRNRVSQLRRSLAAKR